MHNMADKGKEEETNEFTVHERKFSIPENATVYLNQLAAAQAKFNGEVEKRADDPTMRIEDGKYVMRENDQVIMTADFHLICVYAVKEWEKVEDESIPSAISFSWGWVVLPDDPHTQDVTKVTEDLPYEMQPLTFPSVEFKDIGIVEVLKAYAFNVLALDAVFERFSDDGQSCGVFGFYNVEWVAEPRKVQSAPMRMILKEVKQVAKKLQKQGVTGKQAIIKAWESPEILTMVATYRRQKQDAIQSKEQFMDLFKRALEDPSIVFDEPEPTETQDINDEDLQNAMAAIDRALNIVEEQELAKLTTVGDELAD